ncbi:hypothetical protein KC678_04515 [Candidatus Dojkabacteria bacterium]|uniref:Uncharacterized protein n=1 Tax=Candidatus Dojkabacteria bacterium TaxID=2099670 RepID=A0A955L251_9BACT|nr:hypothetical protein [Candidatus Dojkabacteria bacterium]
MNNRKPFSILLLVLIILIVIALVLIFSGNGGRFSGYFGETGVGGVDQALELEAKISVDSITSDDNEIYTVQYTYEFSNPTDKTVYNVFAQNDLDSYFGQFDYTILDVSSASLSLNSNFDGKTNLELLDGTDTLASGQMKTLSVILSFIPAEFEGPFNNSVRIYGYDMDQSQETVNNNQETTGNATNESSNTNSTNTTPPPSTGGTNTQSPNTNNTQPEEIPDYTNLLLTYKIVSQDGATFPFTEGMTVSRDIGNFTIKAIPNMNFSGSIVFSSSGIPSNDIENYGPYTLHDDKLTQLEWNNAGGTYSVNITVYSQRNAVGDIVYSDQINFFAEEIAQATQIAGEAEISFSLTKTEQKQETSVPTETDGIVQDKPDNSNSNLGSVFENNNEDIKNAQEQETGVSVQPETTEDATSQNNVPFQTNSINNLTKLPNTGIELRKGFFLGIFMMIISYDLAILGYTFKILSSLRKWVHEL